MEAGRGGRAHRGGRHHDSNDGMATGGVRAVRVQGLCECALIFMEGGKSAYDGHPSHRLFVFLVGNVRTDVCTHRRFEIATDLDCKLCASTIDSQHASPTSASRLNYVLAHRGNRSPRSKHGVARYWRLFIPSTHRGRQPMIRELYLYEHAGPSHDIVMLLWHPSAHITAGDGACVRVGRCAPTGATEWFLNSCAVSFYPTLSSPVTCSFSPCLLADVGCRLHTDEDRTLLPAWPGRHDRAAVPGGSAGDGRHI